MKRKIALITAVLAILGAQLCHAADNIYMTITDSVNFDDRYITEPVQIKAKVNRAVPKIGGEIKAYIRVNDDGTYEIIRFGE